MANPTTPAPPPLAAARPLATALRLLLPLWVVLVIAAALLALGMGAGRWLLLDEDGARWLLARLPGVEAQGWHGTLAGGQLRAERLRIVWAGGAKSVLIEGLQADGLLWRWHPHAGLWLGLDAQALLARRVEVVTGPPAPALKDLRLPLQLAVAELRVSELVLAGQAPVRGVEARALVLDSRPGAQHAVQQLRFIWDGKVVAGRAQIGNQAPLPLSAQITLAPLAGGDAPAWAAVLHAGGVLERLDLQATLRGVPRAGHDAPALDLKAQVLPYAAWPLAALSARTQALDLAALWPQAPQTHLSGTAEIQSHARDAPISASVQLDNASPGRWDERRLPVRHLELELRGQLQQPGQVELTRFDLTLADAGGPAGHWSGRASWHAHTLTLDTQLAGVNPQRLDGRAAASTFTGPLLATLRGLPSPDPAAGGPAPTLQALQAEWRMDLEGRLEAAPQPVRLLVEGSANAQRIELRRLSALAGNASAELHATAQRAGNAGWQIESAGSLTDFDPLPWWPGVAGSAWRRGPHRLSAGWQFDLRLPAAASHLAPLALVQSLAGNGELRIHDSVLAGVALQADVKLGYAQGNAAPRQAPPAPTEGERETAGGAAQTTAPTRGALHAELRLGGNQLVIDGRGDPAGNGQSDRWQAELKAETLATLAPLTRLHPDLAAWLPRQGRARATLAADGRWPALRTEGSARVQQLQIGPLAVAEGQASWRFESGGEGALSLQAETSGVQYGSQRAEHLTAELHGTLAEHRIEIAAALPLAPPPTAGQLLGLPAAATAATGNGARSATAGGTRAQMLAQGAWQADPAGGGRWRARVERLSVGAWDGLPLAGQPPAGGWADARDLHAEAQFDTDGALVALQAQPGRVQLADTAVLRWDAVQLDLRGERAQIELHADIEPFAVAPLLARLQPGVGWAGDLRLRARVEVKAAARFDADVVLERVDGDLHLAGSEGQQPLGLTELRLALAAHDGVWNFIPTLNGRGLGELRGELRVRSTPERRWPGTDAAIEGALEARVADIRSWSHWVPAGWRLGGELRASAGLSGRFGAPQYTGQVSGSGLAVRNLLQGVNVSDGQLSLRLAGDVAQVERFTLRGGDGTLTITGGATLGRTPRAQLSLKADHFRVLGRVDRHLIASGTAELALQTDQLRLAGSVRVDEGLIDASRADTPTLDEDVTVRGPGEEDVRPTEQAAARPRRDVVVGVDVDLGDKLHVRGRGLDTTLRGKLRLTAPGGRLAAAGTINTERGTYQAYGQKLEIERGFVAFSGPLENPRLDVLALRPFTDIRVGVAITGNLLTPRVRLYSEPEMSDTDKLSWLVLGRAPDGLGRADTAFLQRAAVALLAGEGEAPTDALLRSLGIDEVSLRQSDGDVRATVISLGKQLSRRWYVGYERGVNATTGTWQLIYRIAQRFTLRAQSGADSSLDVILVKRLGEPPADGVRKSIALPP